MQFKNLFTKKLPFFVALGLATVLTSCGSFQYAGYDNDGIYSTDEYDNDDTETPVVTTSTDNSNYYKNYFAENTAEVEAIKEESEVFTDIDSYESDYVQSSSETTEQQPAYGGWGQNNNTVTVNFIDNGWYGYNSPWLINGGFGYGYGYGHYRWNRPWRYGYDNWGWNNPWVYGGYYGYGYHSPWHYGYGYTNYGWNHGYYRSNNRFAYNNSRRGSLLYNDNLSRTGRGNSAISRTTSTIRRSSNSATSNYSRSTSTRFNSNTRTLRSRSTAQPSVRRSSSNSRISRPAAIRTRPTTTRSTRSTRSSSRISTPTRSARSSGSVRSSSSRSSRSSSGSVRSSSNSRSSSGSRSSSSSNSRRGRG
ncbi:hypothetical protein [Winogradskyella bathintestinalis]|uniref:Vitellogenin II n=1 Tax=Winogradskyella bathintestinalis TaxID=3035208 RepID=A0ABT7ZYI5_9FLAO|nr:hypothetical protein [Winogradskyella bathintestinalis]MDN3494054.1 hypothetical protein [Winogradskyella bathintestinalis]